jgi:hypothetical protein
VHYAIRFDNSDLQKEPMNTSLRAIYLGVFAAAALGAGALACSSTSASPSDGGTNSDGSSANVDGRVGVGGVSGAGGGGGGGGGAGGVVSDAGGDVSGAGGVVSGAGGVVSGAGGVVSGAGGGAGTAARSLGSVAVNQGSLENTFTYDVTAGFARLTSTPVQPVPCATAMNLTIGDCIAGVICLATTGDPPESPTVTALDAGAITVNGGSGTAGAATLGFGPIKNAMPAQSGYASARGETQFFAGGDVLVATGAGGPDLPAFKASVVAPNDIVLTAPACALTGCPDLDRTTDLQVTWTGGGAGEVFATYETLGAEHLVIVSCHFGAAGGMGTVPAALLGLLEKLGDPGVSEEPTALFGYGPINEAPFTVADVASTFKVQGPGYAGFLTLK